MTGTGFYCHHDTPVGTLLLAGDSTALWRIAFAEPDSGRPQTPVSAGLNRLADRWQHQAEVFSPVCRQLDEYFHGTRQHFTLTLAPQGTAFQQAVWRALQGIPYGQTASYRDIAKAVNRPRAARAVGMANNRNPVPIVIPCHRVIGSNGQMVGFGGGLAVKKRLLALESAFA